MLKKLLMVILFLTLALAISVKNSYAEEQSPEKYIGKVEWVVDGDTLRIKYYSKDKQLIDLIGIDAPETVENTKAKEDAQKQEADVQSIIAKGKEATKFVRSLIKPGNKITIEFEEEKKRSQGKLLGYVYFKKDDNEEKMLNEEILKAGYAELSADSEELKYKEKLEEALKEAKDNKQGLWAE